MYPIGSVEQQRCHRRLRQRLVGVDARTRSSRSKPRSPAWDALGETKTPLLPEERIGLPEALAAFTINAAYIDHRERAEHGSLEVGKLADLVVLDRNLFEIPAARFPTRRCW